MNKTEFINAVAEKSGLSKVDAKKAVEAFVEQLKINRCSLKPLSLFVCLRTDIIGNLNILTNTLFENLSRISSLLSHTLQLNISRSSNTVITPP